MRSRKMSDAAIQHKTAYDQEYERKNIVKKHIPFNVNNPEDSRRLKWVDKQKNVTKYIKGLIDKDMPGE